VTLARPNRMRILTGECRRLKITMQPPDINASEIHFSLNGNTIIFGLSAIIQDKDDLLIRIIQQRTVYGRFRDLEDFNKKVRISENDVCAFESLKACGAFDSICDIPDFTI
jgi:DNA polymerase III subunit alpha